MFDKHWFNEHQETILSVLNSGLYGGIARRGLWVPDMKHRIVKVTPNAVHALLPDGKVRATLYSNKQHQEAMLRNGKGLWETLHWWDMKIANRLVPSLNAGFDTYSSQPDGTAGYDTYISSSDSSTNFGSNTSVYIGETDGAISISRTLIKFDLSSIPSGAFSNAATLSLWIGSDFSTNARDVKVYRVRRDWVESQATWDIWKTSNNWTTSGCGSTTNDYDSTVWATKNIPASGASGEQQWVFSSTGLTELDKFLNATYSNYGWIMRADTESNDAWSYQSSDGTTPSTRPKLVITYSVPAGGPIIF